MSPPTAITPLARTRPRTAGAKSHRDTLREPGEHDRLVAGADVIDDVVDVVDVVANRVFTVLAGHPGGHDILRPSTIEAVQALRRDERPLVRPGHAREAIHLDFCRFLVAVKADEQPFWGADVADEHSAMRGGADGKSSHGCDPILILISVQVKDPDIRTSIKGHDPNMTSRLAAGVFALTLTASTLASAQGHFPSDEAIREIARQAGTISGKVGIVIGVLEADGSRRVITVGDAPYDGRTLFEIGSITKVFTGILLAEMAERGEVRLEQPVAELLPGDVVVPSRNGRQIRLVDLSTHSSGLPRMPDNFTPADAGNPYVDYTVPKLYDFLRRHELRRDIGVEAEYSNVGVGLLGHALARRAGTSYEALVTARILDPLKMTSTKVTLSPADVARLAPGHDARGEQVQNWDLAEAFAGAGSLRSNVDDMLTFLAANLTPPGSSTLGRAIRSAQTAHFTAAGGRQGGLGWGRSLLKQERNVLTHTGGTGGYLTFVGLDPERRLGVVVLCNQMRVLAGDQTPHVTRIGLHLLDARIPVSFASLEWPFRVLPVILALLLVAGVFVAWRRTGASIRQSTLAAAGMTLGLSAWMAATYLAAALPDAPFPAGTADDGGGARADAGALRRAWRVAGRPAPGGRAAPRAPGRGAGVPAAARAADAPGV